MIAVAIDGPSGAGKSTLAKRVAEALGFLYVDTGACYRGVGLYIMEQRVPLDEVEAIVAQLDDIDLRLAYTNGEQRLIINGRDVSEEIRTPAASHAASVVSAIPEVRRWLLETQRELARNNNVVMDGRDIGTVVLPEADIKIFLTAEPEARAFRRHKEYVAKEMEIGYNNVLDDILERDARDSGRSAAPLKQSGDAVFLDSTDLDFEETLTALLKIIKGRIE